MPRLLDATLRRKHFGAATFFQGRNCLIPREAKPMCHVLIIEDEILVALNLQQLLAEHGATSFDIAETEAEAIQAAIARPPKFISSDVRLKEGTGPKAVQAILHELGAVPVIFVTATPEVCDPCDPPGRVMTKPLHEENYCDAFKEMIAA